MDEDVSEDGRLSIHALKGVQWMQEVSPLNFDFRKGHTRITWEGRQLLLTQHGSSQTTIEIQLDENSKVHEEFQHIFQSPKGLPPPRSQDHLIPLVDNYNPVNLNPYKCSYLEKNRNREIGKGNASKWNYQA
ncbi:hypothetical protein AgCh_023693 [Apium graveolens]